MGIIVQRRRVAELGAGLGVGEDAAGVVVDVGGDEAGAEDGKEEDEPGSPDAPGTSLLGSFLLVGRTCRLASIRLTHLLMRQRS